MIKVDEKVKEYEQDFEKFRISKNQLFFKRIFDIVFSLIGLIVLAPILLIVAISIKIDSKGPIIFKQNRVGKNGVLFSIFKFRTMVINAEQKGRLITVGNDSRITRVGKFIRKYKLDEIPQLFNVLIGDMSFVGPRPEVPKYVELYNESQRQILLVKPGITDYASIKFRNENEILYMSNDPEKTYIEEIMLEKIRLNKKYIRNISLIGDIKLIIKTIMAIVK